MTGKAVNIIVSGSNGRMGQTIIKLVDQDMSLKLVGALESGASQVLGKDAGLNSGIEKLDVKITSVLKDVSIKGPTAVIDFSTISSTLDHVDQAVEIGVPIVIGTTGFNEQQKKRIKEASQKIPIVLAPNMSVGVNVLFKLLDQAARVLGPEYDIEVTEIHHKHKVDSPSGTAMKMAEVLCEATGRSAKDDLNYHREGMVGPRTQKEIGMQTLRGGDVVGEHTAFFFGEGERIEIKHIATSRSTFAAGSIRAAKWLISQQPGLYDMGDVLF